MELNENNIQFIFYKQRLIKNYNKYKKLGNIYYPLKTNSNHLIINNLHKIFNNQDGFLLSNINHYEYLNKLGISPKKMCLINVLTSNDSIKYLYDQGVRFFVFDNYDSLKYFCSYANLKECKIAIRLNTMEVFDDTLMHLGADTKECLRMINLLKNKCFKIGISFYLQTKIKDKPKAMELMINYIINNFKNEKLDFISIAGLKNNLKKEYLEKVKETMKLKEIILEPGKYLVGDTFDLITKIIRVKKIKNKTIVIIKNGIYSGLLDILLYNEKFKISFKNHQGKYIEFSHKKDEKHNYGIYMCGGSSDSGDVIGMIYIEEKYKNDIKKDTEVLFQDIGSYFEEFFMPYGGDINKKYICIAE